MRLIFARSYAPGSLLIRLLTFSKWSHVAAVFEDGWAIEATWPRVRVTRVEDIIADHSAHEFRELELLNDGELFLTGQIGKPYDLMALFWFLNPWRKWEEDDKWFCSELIAKASGKFSEAARVSPQMLYLLSKAQGA